MKENSFQDILVPEKTGKDTRLESIVSQGENLSDARKSIRLAAKIILIAAVGHAVALLAGFTSPYIFPILMVMLAGNQIYALRTGKKEKKLNETKKAYESEFGVIVSPK